jgi:small-conductance mechanosensitive channel
MLYTFPSLSLLALTTIALGITRGRSLLIRVLVEAVLLLLIGLFLLWRGTSPLPALGSSPTSLGIGWIRALAVIWWLIGAKLVVSLTVLIRGRDPKSRETRLFSDLAAAVIYITAVLIILNSVLDLNVSGLLVTSGVIAIVLGLALQNTLADVFSGIAVSLEHPFQVGDRVLIGDNVEGIVVQNNWRSVRIHTDGDDLATIPNSIIAKGQIINRSVPTRRRAGKVEIVAPSIVASEEIVELMRQATMLCPNLLAMPAPSITISRFGLRSSTYAASFFVSDSLVLATAKSTLLRQISRLFRHAGVGLAAPMSPLELLGSLVLFEALSRQELETLCGKLIVHVVEPGETIFEQGAASTSIYIIQAGVMEISHRNSEGLDETFGRIGVGEYIGELGLITNSPRALTMKSLTDGHVLELPGASLIDLLKSNAALNTAMEKSVRKGLALLDRDDAARTIHPQEQSVDIFGRIKAFFGIYLNLLPHAGEPP